MSYSYLPILMALIGFVAMVSAQAKPQNFKLFIFREDCFDLFFNKFDFFSNKDCLAVTISKGLGIAIIAGSAVLKVPQIAKIFKNKSV